MPYATQADLVSRFGAEELVQLTDRLNGNAIDSAIVSVALADADAILDGYLGGRYATPVTPTPPLLLRLAADVARFLLHKDRPSESVRQAYEDALKMLGDLADGTAVLAGALPATSAATPALPQGLARFTGGDKSLDRASLGDFYG